MALIVATFGERVADEIKPSEIDGWLGKHAWRPATKNRYKNVFVKTYKIAFADGRVTGNPARLVEQRAENNSRIRYLLAEEESRLREVITRRFPIHLPSFDIALNTGMRKQEQFSLEWSEVSLSRRRIHLTMTKNGSTREIPKPDLPAIVRSAGCSRFARGTNLPIQVRQGVEQSSGQSSMRGDIQKLVGASNSALLP
jgi:hypothetical protein